MQSISPEDSRFWLRVAWKGLILFGLFNLVFLLTTPPYGKLSLYNVLFAGRLRLPYSDQPAQSYNVTITNLDAMFKSHILSGTPKTSEEYRVLLIGDSATWGYLLPPHQTLAAFLNQANLRTPQNQRMVFYNLGYPVMSLLKDTLLLERGLEYQPDLVLWFVTLESFPMQKQLYSPLLETNQAEVNRLISQLNLNQILPLKGTSPQSFWQRSLIGQRKPLADWLRFQLYGFLWTATGIDHDIPQNTPQKQIDLSPEVEFYGQQPPTLKREELAFAVIDAAYRLSHPIPIILINEPMFISSGLNSDLRYNFYYPRWAYDQYRELLATYCQEKQLTCFDLWNLISADDFTNTAIHMNPHGTQETAQWIAKALQNWAQNR
jgi:lysophospholipase L1-like esterase